MGEENRQYTFNKATYFIAKVLPMKIFKALAEMLRMLGKGLLKYFFHKLREEESESGGRPRWLHNTQYTFRMSFNIHCSASAMRLGLKDSQTRLITMRSHCKVSAITLQPIFHGAVVLDL